MREGVTANEFLFQFNFSIGAHGAHVVLGSGSGHKGSPWISKASCVTISCSRRCSCASPRRRRWRRRSRSSRRPRIWRRSRARSAATGHRRVAGARLSGSALRRAEAELHSEAPQRRSADRRRPRARDRLAAAAADAEPEREDPAGRPRLSRRVARRAGSWRFRPGRSRARWATSIRRAIRTTGSIPTTAASSRRRSPRRWRASPRPIAAYFEQRYADFDRRLDRGAEAMDGGDGAVQGHEDRHLPPLLAELHRARSGWTSSATSSRSPAFRRRRRTPSS